MDIACAGLVLLPGTILTCRAILSKLRKSAPESDQAWTLVAIYATIGAATYAAIIAFGRAGFVAAGADVQTTVIAAKSRFHFWPIAAMLPYAWLGWAQVGKNASISVRKLGIPIAVLMLVPKSPAAFDQTNYLRIVDTMSRAGAHCVVAKLTDLDAGRPVVCDIMTGDSQDLTPTLQMLRARNASMYQTLLEEGGLEK
jgi:hypothetical protein